MLIDASSKFSMVNIMSFIWENKTSQKLSKHQNFPGGMHGYDSDYSEMHGIFYANGPSFMNGVRIDPFENINIYPMICKNLNLSPYQDNLYWDTRLLEDGVIFK